MELSVVQGLEALLFLAAEPVPTGELAAALDVAEDEVDAACEELAATCAAQRRGVTVRRSGGGWRMYTADAAAPVVERHVLAGRTGRLSPAALETLAVIAYKQPLTRAAIGEIRGVAADAAVRSLVARGYVVEVGQQDSPGQPGLYGTTTAFLEALGLDDLSELPELSDHLADDDAPDEPDDLAAARRLLAADRPIPRVTGPGDVDDRVGRLTDRLEEVARVASERLEGALRATRPPDEEE